jgi:hypothetical protein
VLQRRWRDWNFPDLDFLDVDFLDWDFLASSNLQSGIGSKRA